MDGAPGDGARSRTGGAPPPASGDGRRPRVGVWATDPITDAGLAAVLPDAGFEPVTGPAAGSADVLLAVTGGAPDDLQQLRGVLAAVGSLPVVWLRGRAAGPIGGGAGGGAPGSGQQDATSGAEALALGAAQGQVRVVDRQESSSEALSARLLDALWTSLGVAVGHAPHRGGAQGTGVVRQRSALGRPDAPQRLLDDGDAPTGSLSELELGVLRLLSEGRDTSEISQALFYSERTVKNVVGRAVRRLGATNRAQAVATALHSGLI